MEIEIDDTRPLSEAYLVNQESSERCNFVSGDVVTRFYYNSIEKQTLEEFAATTLADLKARKDTLTVVRDLASGRANLILDDCVLKFNLRNVQETTIDELAACLTRQAQIDLLPEIQYPLVAYIKDDQKYMITVFIDSHRRTYHHGPYKKEIWLPPLWFKVEMSHAMNVLGARLAVVPNREPKTLNTKLYWWPLGNSQVNSGGLCFGSSQVKLTLPDDATTGEIIASTFAQFTGAEFNTDLSSDIRVEMLEKAWKDTHGELPKDLSTANLQRMTAKLLEQPGGWLGIKWKPLTCGTKEFLYGSRW